MIIYVVRLIPKIMPKSLRMYVCYIPFRRRYSFWRKSIRFCNPFIDALLAL